MIIKGVGDSSRPGRTAYPLDGFSVPTDHFVIRETTPETPFDPHRHENAELWFIVDGRATVSLDGKDHAVETGDLIRLDPWVTHGLSTTGKVRWICIG